MTSADRRVLVAAHAALLATVGVGLLAWAQSSDVWPGYLPVPWWAIALAFFIVEATALHIEIRRETHSLSLSGIPLLLGLLALNPAVLLMARLLGNGLALVVIRRRTGLKLVWNLSLYTVETGAAAVLAAIALAPGRPMTMDAWIVLLAAVLVAELIGLISVPIVIMIAESELRFSLFAQIGRSQLIAVVSSTFGTVTAAAMIELPWLAAFALIPLVGVASLLRMFGRLGKEHHDLQQLHSFTNAIAGRDSLDAGLSQLATILRASATALAVSGDDGTFTVRIYRNRAPVDVTIVVPDQSIIEGNSVVAIGPESEPSEVKSLIEQLGGEGGLVVPIGDHTGGHGYIVLIDRLGATNQFSEDEVQLFSSLAATLGSRLSADRLLDQLETQARLDALTGLANRTTIEAELDRRIGDTESSGAVLLLDLDRFKDVNDSLGHHFGDQLLRLVADRLEQNLRKGDLAGRLGGDEFAVIVEDDADHDLDAQLAGLAKRLTAPVDLDGITLEVGSSIGIARWPTDSTNSAELLRLADIAMYEAKRTHQQWIQYEPTIDHASADRLSLVGQIRDAIANRELRIHLQPQVRATDLKLVGAEALVRWHHPERGMISPGEFLSLAEQSSLASAITRHVINEAVVAAGQLRADGHNLTIWVNLMARDLLDYNLAPAVATALVQSGTEPARIGFEVTESSLIINIEAAIANLEALRRLGCRTSVDDFGTGYASLQYLQRLPIDEVKIDQSFVTDATINPDSAAIVQSTTRLIRDLGKEVVAEGVEDQATLELLRAIGCNTIQGYHISRPVEVEAFRRWAVEHHRSLLRQQA